MALNCSLKSNVPWNVPWNVQSAISVPKRIDLCPRARLWSVRPPRRAHQRGPSAGWHRFHLSKDAGVSLRDTSTPAFQLLTTKTVQLVARQSARCSTVHIRHTTNSPTYLGEKLMHHPRFKRANATYMKTSLDCVENKKGRPLFDKLLPTMIRRSRPHADQRPVTALTCACATKRYNQVV
jgi:hypothetical protein